MLTGWASSPDADGSGWAGAWSEQLAARYPWLQAIASIPLDRDGVTDPGDALLLPGRAALDETFTMGAGERIDGETHQRNRVHPPKSLDDVVVALVLVSPDGDIWWASRIHG